MGVSSHLFKCPYFLLDLGDFKQKKGILRKNILKIKTVFLFHILKFSSIKADCGLSSIILNEGYCSYHFLLNVTEILLSPSPSMEKEIVF